MSDVELFYNAICAKWQGSSVPWGELDPQKQIMFVQGLNMLLQVFH